MKKQFVMLIMIVLSLFAVTPGLLAQSGNSIELSWHVLGSGGAASNGGNVTLKGTLGQPVTGQSGNGNVDLFGGYWGPGNNAPLAVTLASFTAVQQDDFILLTWETTSELENRGFNLYRGTSSAGPSFQLNEMLIPSQSPGNSGGFIYTWEDHIDLVPDTVYFYWIEDVDIYGAATMHGPVSAAYMMVPTAVHVVKLDATSQQSVWSVWRSWLTALIAAIR